MRSKKTSRPVTQRQLRVGEMIKQALGTIFVRGEAKLPNINTNSITVTEVRMLSLIHISEPTRRS